MHKQLFLIALLGILCFHSSYSQQDELLNSKDTKRIAKAEKKISKAESLVEKADPYKDKIADLKSAGASLRKIKRYEKKANNKIILSASYYKDGYSKKYSAYEKAIKRNIKSGFITDSDAQLEKANDAFKKGRKWRRNSKNESDVNKGVEYLLMANNVQVDAIKHLDKVLVKAPELEPIVEDIIPIDTITAPIILEMPIEEAADSIVSDSIITTTTVAPAIVEEVIPAAAAVSTAIIATDTVKPENDIYFTIQIVADKKPLGSEQLDALYAGNTETIEHTGDGWFKYSIGRYQSYEEAQEAISTENVKGFVVAYKGTERISTRKAREATQQ